MKPQYFRFKNIFKTSYTLDQKYLMEIPIIFFYCKTISQAKSKMKPKFPVPVHHDIRHQAKSALIPLDYITCIKICSGSSYSEFFTANQRTVKVMPYQRKFITTEKSSKLIFTCSSKRQIELLAKMRHADQRPEARPKTSPQWHRKQIDPEIEC